MLSIQMNAEQTRIGDVTRATYQVCSICGLAIVSRPVFCTLVCVYPAKCTPLIKPSTSLSVYRPSGVQIDTTKNGVEF